MINPHIQHALVESPYNQRRSSCEKEATMQFNALLNHPVENLRDVSWEEFTQYRDQLIEAAQRAEHVIAEIARLPRVLNYLNNRIFMPLDNYSMIRMKLPALLSRIHAPNWTS